MIYLGKDPVSISGYVPPIDFTKNAEVGQFTPTTNLFQISIPHNLGRTPTLMLVFDANHTDITVAPELGLLCCYILPTQTGYISQTYQINANKSGYLGSTMNNNTYPPSFDDTQVTFSTGLYYNGKYLANRTYQYILI